MNNNGIEVMLDDRDVRLGVKLNDCDLIGIPMRIVIGKKSIENNCVEFKLRTDSEAQNIEIDKIVEYVSDMKKKLFLELGSTAHA